MPTSTSCKAWLTGTNFFVYFSHFLSAWGDRMWSFGVGLFLININPDSLHLTAVYGLCMGLSILLFGALVGDIVDKSPRLKAAQIALVLQNAFVVLCATVVYIFLAYRWEILSVGSWTTHLAYALIIILSVLSRLTSLARQIAVEKDWIVEICGKDFDMLATMTASLRRIDLATQVLAPIATGLIMSYAGVEFGALFIGSWNIGSVVVEYYFLWKVYNTVPALKRKKNLKKSEILAMKEENKENEKIIATSPAENPEEPDIMDISAESEFKTEQMKDTGGQTKSDEPCIMESSADNTAEGSNQQPKIDVKSKEATKIRKCPRIFHSLEKLFLGWPVYVRYDVVHAGIALALLYMTVLGFDSITVGYAKMQGITEGLVGVMMGVAASFGIFGTFMYPVMRRRLGLLRTGMFGLSLQVTCLTLCVISVWVPDSKFDLSRGFGLGHGSLINVNCTNNDLEDITSDNNSIIVTPSTNVNVTNMCNHHLNKPESHISIWMLLAGIATARFGLWVADLTITQLFMERVIETERGKVNGVQNSLNQLMDMLKFLMVVLAPYEHQYGLLILISFSFICCGWLFYANFLRNARGHFFHFEKCLLKDSHQNENKTVEVMVIETNEDENVKGRI